MKINPSGREKMAQAFPLVNSPQMLKAGQAGRWRVPGGVEFGVGKGGGRYDTFGRLAGETAAPRVATPPPVALPAGEGLDVKQCGAKGDGAADDTAALQRALDTAQHGLVLVTRGVYRIADTLVARRPLTLLFDAGASLALAPSYTNELGYVNVQGDENGAENDYYTCNQIYDLRLTGLTPGNTDAGTLYWDLTGGQSVTLSFYRDAAKTQLVARATGAARVPLAVDAMNGSGISGRLAQVVYTADDLHSAGAPNTVTTVFKGHTVLDIRSNDVTLQDVRIDGTGLCAQGWYYVGTEVSGQAAYYDNRVATGMGIRCLGSADAPIRGVTVRGGAIRNTPWSGIWTRYTAGLRVEGVTLEACATNRFGVSPSAVSLLGAEGPSVTGCRLRDIGMKGIGVSSNSSNALIADNDLQQINTGVWGHAAIYLARTTGSVVVGNRIGDATGIKVGEFCVGSAVVGNSLAHCHVIGIIVQGAEQVVVSHNVIQETQGYGLYLDIHGTYYLPTRHVLVSENTIINAATPRWRAGAGYAKGDLVTADFLPLSLCEPDQRGLYWDAIAPPAGVTRALSASDRMVGIGALKLTVSSSVGANTLLAAEAVSGLDLRQARALRLWVKTDTALAAGAWRLILSPTGNPNAGVEAPLPAVAADGAWHNVEIPLTQPDLPAKLYTVGVQQTTPCATTRTVRLDQIVALPRVVAPWQPNQAYQVGDEVAPTAGGAYYHVCRVAGTSAAAEPGQSLNGKRLDPWCARAGGVTQDGGAQWTCRPLSDITGGYWRYTFQNAASGTAGATPPTHTSGAISDGALTWDQVTYYGVMLRSHQHVPLEHLVIRDNVIRGFFYGIGCYQYQPYALYRDLEVRGNRLAAIDNMAINVAGDRVDICDNTIDGVQVNQGILLQAAKARQWTPATPMILGAFVIPVPQNAPYPEPALVYQCARAGVTGGGEPAWPTTPGATVADGGAEWTCRTPAEMRAALRYDRIRVRGNTLRDIRCGHGILVMETVAADRLEVCGNDVDLGDRNAQGIYLNTPRVPALIVERNTVCGGAQEAGMTLALAPETTCALSCAHNTLPGKTLAILNGDRVTQGVVDDNLCAAIIGRPAAADPYAPPTVPDAVLLAAPGAPAHWAAPLTDAAGDIITEDGVLVYMPG